MLGIIQYAERIRDMHDLAKYLFQNLKSGDEYDQAY